MDHLHNDNKQPRSNTGDDTSSNNINNYIENLDVSNVLTVDLLGHEQPYIDPGIHQPTTKNSAAAAAAAASVVDPKKTCPFCHKTFSHPGSMGRHLDQKKGTKLHPADIIEQMRSDVKRRGDIVKIKERRRLRAKRYNSKTNVKERTKIQRRARDRLLRAKKRFVNTFYNRLGKPELGETPTFPRLVFYFLSAHDWPHDPPTLETYRSLCGVLNDKFQPTEEENAKIYDQIMRQVHTASEQWLVLSDVEKQQIWIRELRQAAVDALNNHSLYDLRYRNEWVLRQAKKRADDLKNGVINNEGDSDSEKSDVEEEVTDDEKNAQSELRQSQENEDYYDQTELAAVAEAVVNNSQKDPNVHLDPQLIK